MSTESRVILDSGHISLRRNSMYDCETYTDVPVWKWCFNEERAEGDGKANNRLNWIYLCEMFGRKLAACFFFISALLITRIFFDNYDANAIFFNFSKILPCFFLRLFFLAFPPLKHRFDTLSRTLYFRVFFSSSRLKYEWKRNPSSQLYVIACTLYFWILNKPNWCGRRKNVAHKGFSMWRDVFTLSW